MTFSLTNLKAAICIAVGNESLEDCDLFTSSFGFRVLLISFNFLPSKMCPKFEITSFIFILV